MQHENRTLKLQIHKGASGKLLYVPEEPLYKHCIAVRVAVYPPQWQIRIYSESL